MNKTESILMIHGDRATRDKINMRRSFGAKRFNEKKRARRTAAASRRTNRTN